MPNQMRTFTPNHCQLSTFEKNRSSDWMPEGCTQNRTPTLRGGLGEEERENPRHHASCWTPRPRCCPRELPTAWAAVLRPINNEPAGPVDLAPNQLVAALPEHWVVCRCHLGFRSPFDQGATQRTLPDPHNKDTGWSNVSTVGGLHPQSCL